MALLLTRLLPCLPRTRKAQLIFIYALDWLTIIILAGATFGIDKIKPFHREFSVGDKSISHVYKENTVSDTMLFVISAIIPLALILFVGLGIRRSIKDVHHGLLGLGLCLTMTLVITVSFKITVGRLRPDWMSRCLPKADSVDPPYGLSNYTICTRQDGYIFYDGMKSFPSGHTSLSHAGLGFLSLFLAGKLHIFDGKGYTIRGFIAVFPLIGAGLVGVSRTTDYRHHWQDVLVGALIGLASAYFSYRQFYPTLESKECHRPLPIKRLLDAADIAARSPNAAADVNTLAGHPISNAVTAVPAVGSEESDETRPLSPKSNSPFPFGTSAFASGNSLATPPTQYPPSNQNGHSSANANNGYQQRADRDQIVNFQ
ncbi:acid phosphatase/Vanadium-dependent haloperoxidase [Ramicandelaber brevisporus]|nr:acid phosphatase/Vanadium-dependent haloperoxidase [Ramicandelaber brevisporus]